jgi:hypothetical protein
VIFPTVNNVKIFTYLDRFLATRIGAPAYEVRDSAGKYTGIYTSCFREAYLNPDESMTAMINGVKVVPNKSLERYLLSEVPKRAEISDVLEYPDSQVTSPNYIGRAETAVISEVSEHGPPFHTRGGGCRCGGSGCGWRGHIPPQRKKITVPLTLKDVSLLALNRVGLKFVQTQSAAAFSAKNFQQVTDKSGFGATSAAIANARGPSAFKYGTGINVVGARIRRVVSSKVTSWILREGNGSNEPGVVEINTEGQSQSTVGLEFEDGSGAAIAALRNFVARVVVEKGLIISVSYAPTHPDGRAENSAEADFRDRLHAVVATSAKFGVFRIDDSPEIRDKNAKALAEAIRRDGGVDPTLALYGAYAYADAGLYEQVRDLHTIMKAQLGISLFDITMLSGASATGESEAQAPFCPMLSQGWQYLGIKGLKLAERLSGAQIHIVPALWTTFDRDGMNIVESLV